MGRRAISLTRGGRRSCREFVDGCKAAGVCVGDQQGGIVTFSKCQQFPIFLHLVSLLVDTLPSTASKFKDISVPPEEVATISAR
jgi:hypothetical protein